MNILEKYLTKWQSKHRNILKIIICYDQIRLFQKSKIGLTFKKSVMQSTTVREYRNKGDNPYNHFNNCGKNH